MIYKKVSFWYNYFSICNKKNHVKTLSKMFRNQPTKFKINIEYSGKPLGKGIIFVILVVLVVILANPAFEIINYIIKFIH